ncbi:MAG: SEC-C metal-binding domain-containing protein [Bacteroidota bacterium]
MPFIPFHNYFPEIAEKESRTIQVFNDPKLAGDHFLLMELFCDEPKCDCRRVMLNVFSLKRKSIVAVINFGWESEKFYENWFGSKDKKLIRELRGPSINDLSERTDITKKIFEHVKLTLENHIFVQRIKLHYVFFREHIEKLASGELTNISHSIKMPGRNDLCSCGSGKKFKNCCLS